MQPSCHISPKGFAARHSMLERSIVAMTVACFSLLLALAAPAGAFPTPPGSPGAPASLVPITQATLTVGTGEATVTASVGWNPGGAAQGLVQGDLRVEAINASTRLPTVVATKNIPAVETVEPVKYTFPITDPAGLAALAPGNRVVITATQHKRTVPGALTQPIYATVHELQAGPSRGAVGNLDCSGRPIQGNGNYDNCDFTGAVLIQANLPGSLLEEADFTGAWLTGAALSRSNMAGAWLAGTDMSRTTSTNLSAALSFDPDLKMTDASSLNSDNFAGAVLDGADFTGASIELTTFFSDPMNGSSFANARLRDDELTGTKLQGAKMQGITIDTASTFFRSQLQNANLLGGKIADLPRFETEGRFCNTTMPNGSINNRDC